MDGYWNLFFRSLVDSGVTAGTRRRLRFHWCQWCLSSALRGTKRLRCKFDLIRCHEATASICGFHPHPFLRLWVRMLLLLKVVVDTFTVLKIVFPLLVLLLCFFAPIYRCSFVCCFTGDGGCVSVASGCGGRAGNQRTHSVYLGSGQRRGPCGRGLHQAQCRHDECW